MAALSSGMLPGSITFICFIASLWTVTETRIHTKPPYGYPCTTDANCRIGFKSQYTMFADHESRCIDGICDCDESLQYRVYENGNYECAKGKYIMKTDYGECRANNPDTCIDGTCEKRHQDMRCFCQEGSVLVGNTCRKATIASYADNCTIPDSGPIPVCNYKKSMYCNNTDMKCACLNFALSGEMSTVSNTTGLLFYDGESGTCLSAKHYAEIYPNETLAGLDEFCGITEKIPKVCGEENMFCKDSKCKCKRKFYPIASNGTCESYQSYVDLHNLTSYKVAPGQYCYSDAECITGLDCHKNLCACPYPCTFDKVTIACDCGAVSATEGASSAILVGIIGGALIMYFWYRMIKKIVDKGKEKSQHNSSYNGITHDLPPDDTYIPPAYDISPNRYPSTAGYCTNDIPLIPPTNAPPYPLNPSTDAPPYPPNPSTNAPPYTPNPSSNASPYPPNPSPYAPPYPPNPSTDAPPYPLNPPTNAPPYPLNPPTNVPNPPNYSQPTGPVGFSSSANPPSAPPYGAPSDGSMPPQYTPITQNDKPGVDIYNPIIS